MVKRLPTMWRTRVQSLGWEDPLAKEMATHSSILAWRQPRYHDGVITDLEPDILECEVKWALESITMNKASGGDGIPVELFQILKDDAVKVLHSICQQIWITFLPRSKRLLISWLQSPSAEILDPPKNKV